jgi:riboflavin biosynthesis pyrimidine reductase
VTVGLEPLELLFENDGLPALELPDQLRDLYAGDLGFDEPCLYANFVASVDGVIAIPALPDSNSELAQNSKADKFLMGILRAFADVVLIGAGVLRAAPKGTWQPEKVYPPAADAFGELRRRVGRDGKPEVAVVTGHGHIDPSHPLLETGALVLTSQSGRERLQGQLPDATTVLVLGESPMLDGRTIADALYERGHRLILSEAGPHVFGALLDANAVDELFLTISPVLAGDAGPGTRLHLVEAADLFPLHALDLVSLRRHGDHLFARYRVRNGESAG